MQLRHRVRVVPAVVATSVADAAVHAVLAGIAKPEVNNL